MDLGTKVWFILNVIHKFLYPERKTYNLSKKRWNKKHDFEHFSCTVGIHYAYASVSAQTTSTEIEIVLLASSVVLPYNYLTTS